MSRTRRCWLVVLAVLWAVTLIGGPGLQAAEKKVPDDDLDLLQDLLGADEKPPKEPAKKEEGKAVPPGPPTKKEAPKKAEARDALEDLLGLPGADEPAKPEKKATGAVVPEGPEKKEGSEEAKVTVPPRPSWQERIRGWAEELKKADDLGRGKARAAWRLGTAGSGTALVDLKNVLESGQQPLVVVSAVWALADLAPRTERLGAGQGAAAVEALIGAVSHRDSWVRQEAIWQVSRLGAKGLPAEVTGAVRDRGIAALVSALQDEKWFVREYAVRALGRLADPRRSAETVVATARGRAADVLGRKDDPDPRVRARLEAVAARFRVQ